MLAMAKKALSRRVILSDNHYGDEPVINEKSSRIDLIHAYNYYNYHHSHDDAKNFVLEYARTKKSCEKMKVLIRKIQKLNSFDLINIGWNCKILLNGGKLPEEIHNSIWKKLDLLIQKNEKSVPETEPVSAPVVSIQERIVQKANSVLADLEDQIDLSLKEKSNFNPTEYFSQQNLSPAIAKRVADYYNPIYAELLEVLKGEDSDLKEGYKTYTKKYMRKQVEFIKSIISACSTQTVVKTVIRKPRKKKVKPAHVIVRKLKFLSACSEYSLKSISATEIVGAQQLWVFDSKKRLLTVFNSLGPVGLSVKGTTILGYDENTSITKKLRKPEVSLKEVLSGGKVVLKNLMSKIKSKDQKAKNRLNSDTVLLRVNK